MDNIAEAANERRGLPAFFSDICAAICSQISKINIKKTAVVSCPLGAVIVAGAVMFNLKHVKVITADKTVNLTTFKTNAADILKDNGITTSKYDKVMFSGFKDNNATIKILPAFKVSVIADNKVKTAMAADGTVADILKKTGVSLGSEDIISMPLSAKVKSGDVITIKRVTYETKVNLVPIAFNTETTPSVLYKKGVRKVLEEGREGQNAVTTKVKLIDGVATGETKIQETVSVNPVSRKVLVGTASATPVSTLVPPSSLELDDRGVPKNYLQCIKGKATAYHVRHGSLTSTGRTVRAGYVAVDPRLIPYGSKLYIMSTDGSFVYGYSIAADTGDFVHNGSGILTDLYFPSDAACSAFGVRSVAVYILK